MQVNGREAETLAALVAAGPQGFTSLEGFKAGWAVRLSAYIFDLRKQGIGIATSYEPHDGGTHARYTLTTPVTILAPGAGFSEAA